MSDERLKPCPFCGGEAEVIFEEYSGDHIVNEFYVRCTMFNNRLPNCLVMPNTITYDSEEEAIDAWNRRV